jgi:hypothetical protein
MRYELLPGKIALLISKLYYGHALYALFGNIFSLVSLLIYLQ